MAEESNDTEPKESNGKDRATVALVDAKVDGLKEYLRAEFGNVKDDVRELGTVVKEDVRALGSVVGDVIRQGVLLDGHEKRIGDLEDDKEARKLWRRDRLPSIAFGCIGALGTLYGLLTQFGVVHFH